MSSYLWQCTEPIPDQGTTSPLITDLVLLVSDHDSRLLALAQDRSITSQRSWVRDDGHTTMIIMLDYELSFVEIGHSFTAPPIPYGHDQLAKLQNPDLMLLCPHALNAIVMSPARAEPVRRSSGSSPLPAHTKSYRE